MLKRLLAVLTAMLLTLATFAFAAELRGDHPTTYTVVKGDTLWDISARFLTKPWLWPEIWQANPQVKDPHRIYPGDVLSLVYINGEPRLTMDSGPQPQIRVGEAIDTVPLSQIETWLKQYSVVQEPKTFPYVVGMEGDHIRTQPGQVVFVRGMIGAQPGQMVNIARPTSYYAMGRIKNGRRVGGQTSLDYRANRSHIHWGYGDFPAEAHGEKLGYEMEVNALGEVTQVQGEITVILLRNAQTAVEVGDRVLAVEDQPYCNCFTPHPAASIPEGAQLLAIDNDQGLEHAGKNMVVALSIGSRDGVDNGTVYSVWHPGTLTPDVVRNGNAISAKADRLTMPDRYMGHVMVFRTFDRVSYGLMMDALRPVQIGDFLKHPDAVQ